MLGQACLIPMTPHNGGGFASIQIWTGGGKSGGAINTHLRWEAVLITLVGIIFSRPDRG